MALNMDHLAFAKLAPAARSSEIRQNRENYIRSGDRARVGPDPYFVGRESEIAMFVQALELTAARAGSAGKAETLLIQGPPGAGKTALLEECAALAGQRPDCAVVRLLPEELCSARGLIEAIDRAVDASAAIRLGRALDQRGWRAGPVGVPPKPARPESMAALMETRAQAWKDQVILLLVDEAQNIPSNSSQARAAISYLHGASRKTRILLACYGLGNTQDKLAELGVSRLGRERLTTLRSLAPEQAEESLRRVFSTCGVTGAAGERGRWIKTLASLSLGWPQHLRAIAALALEHLAAHRMNVSASSLDAVAQAGIEARQRYYDQRLSGVALWRPAYREIAEALRRDEAPCLHFDRIAEIARPHLKRWDEPLRAFIANSLRAGVLGAEDSRYSIPIPSFADHLLRT